MSLMQASGYRMHFAYHCFDTELVQILFFSPSYCYSIGSRLCQQGQDRCLCSNLAAIAVQRKHYLVVTAQGCDSGKQFYSLPPPAGLVSELGQVLLPPRTAVSPIWKGRHKEPEGIKSGVCKAGWCACAEGARGQQKGMTGLHKRSSSFRSAA